MLTLYISISNPSTYKSIEKNTQEALFRLKVRNNTVLQPPKTKQYTFLEQQLE